jgi:hypothetical protein
VRKLLTEHLFWQEGNVCGCDLSMLLRSFLQFLVRFLLHHGSAPSSHVHVPSLGTPAHCTELSPFVFGAFGVGLDPSGVFSRLLPLLLCSSVRTYSCRTLLIRTFWVFEKRYRRPPRLSKMFFVPFPALFMALVVGLLCFFPRLSTLNGIGWPRSCAVRGTSMVLHNVL